MEIRYFGANCVRVQTKKVGVVIDDNLDEIGQKSITKDSDIALYTSKGDTLFKNKKPGNFLADKPGEYEVSDISIKGIAARSHMDEEGTKTAIVYRLIIDDIKIGVLGHIHPDLNDDQLEALGMIDVLIVPVGGSGYTLDSVGALKLIKKISPHIVVPTHYDDKKLKYDVPQAELEEVRKTLSMEPADQLDELKIKGREFSEGTKLVILSRE
ncbi:MBL fold metallo-hydrolase [Candidatus Saccharibacteria bacterium]|nr:MBL fold metallo-hydrolase [Candidatus Saccharibacteria bacterium]